MSWNNSRDSAKRTKSSKISGPVVGLTVGVVLVLLCGLGYYYNRMKEVEPELQAGVYQHFNRLTAWLSDSKHRIQEVKQQLDQVAHANQEQIEAEQPVHFEFYATLPAMKVVQQEDMIPKEVKETPAINLANSKVVKSITGRSFFLDPKELEEDFAQVVPRQGYVLQLATFSKLNNAEHYRDGLKGYHVEIIKAYVGERHLYRVQVGPYPSRDEVKATAELLKKKGYTGIVRKIQMG